MTNPDAEVEDRILLNHWKGRVSVRSQQFRLDNKGKLLNLVDDPKQLRPIRDKQVKERLSAAAADWKQEIMVAQNETQLPFTVGYVDFPVTHLPADDAMVRGNIKRSNKLSLIHI